MRFGDLYVERGDRKAARRFYERAAESGPASVAAYAHYRLAWCGGSGSAGDVRAVRAASDGATDPVCRGIRGALSRETCRLER